MPFRHTVTARYVDCDMQRVVHNAVYAAWCDDAVDTWVRSVFADDFESAGYDFMLKRLVIEWHAAARFRDRVDLDCAVTRWGTTSYEVTVDGTVDGGPIFTAAITYVSVTPGTTSPTPVPEAVRAALSA